jgi:ketosteroid isomerase-like protein
VLDGWVAASRARDAAANIAFYSDTLNPYFNRSSYPASKVRDERARVYEMYQTLDIEITNLKVTPDATGNTAIATFDKTWTFESTEKFSSGSVRAQMWFAKSGGRWLITGEKDLKVYYLNRK